MVAASTDGEFSAKQMKKERGMKSIKREIWLGWVIRVGFYFVFNKINSKINTKKRKKQREREKNVISNTFKFETD